MFTAFFRKTYNFLQANHRFVSIVFASAVAVGFLWIFGVGSLQATWYSDTSGSDMWDYRQKITIDSGQIDSNLQDFPVYVDLSDLGSDFFNNVQADGADIRITTADGETELPREVVSVNTASSTGELHFKADNLSSTADTVFYIYYGSSSADNYAVGDTYGRNAVWSDYEAVWHLNEDPSGTAPQFNDATGNGWDGTAEGSMTGADLVDAEIGKGIDFDGVDDRINAGTTLFGLDIDYSLSAWAITDDSTNGLGGLTGRWDANNGVTILQRSGVLGALHDGEYGNLDDSENMSSTTFSKAKTTYDLDTGDRVMYVDGGQVNTDNQATPADEPGASDPWEIGAYGNNGQFFDGIVDEARLKNTVDSPDWESAEYTNQSNPNTFYTIDAQETQSSSNVPFGDNPDGDFADTDWDYRQKITIDSSQVDSNLTDFPVYVDLSDLGSQFFNNVTAGGGDIRVTAGDGTTELAREVVSVDTGSNTGELHFNADTISSSSDTDFYIYYGNEDANDYLPTETYGRNAVWSDYEAVWHLNEDPSDTAQFTDATGNGHDATANGAMTSGDLVSASLGNGLAFDGSDDYLDAGSGVLPTSVAGYTISAWAFEDSGATTAGIAGNWASHDGAALSTRENKWRILHESNNNPGSISTFAPIKLGHQVWTGTELILYVEGNENETVADSQSIGAGKTNFFIGQYNDNYFLGTIDEVRVRHDALSADWVSSENTNQNSPTTFYTVGTQESDNTIFGDDPSGDFADTDWNYREKITIDSSQIGSTLTDFPVYVDLSDLSSSFFSNVNSDGGDIRVTNASGTELAREVVSVDTGSNTGELHFKADSISSSNDTTFYIYYGNTDANNYAVTESFGRNDVWSDYEAVWHLGEDPTASAPQFTDSTGNGYDGTADSMDSSNSVNNGKLGKSIELYDNVDRIILGGTIPWTGDKSISAWGASDGTQGVYGMIGNTDASGDRGFEVRYDSDGQEVTNELGIISRDFDFNNNLDVEAGLQHFTITRNSANNDHTAYVDAQAPNNGNPQSTSNTPDLKEIGAIRGDRSRDWNGRIDELRVSNFVISTDWNSAEYTNQSTTTDFYTVGSQQTDTTVFGDDPDGDFADTDWNYREKITIDSSQIGSDLTDFPIYVDLADLSSQFFSNVNSDGGDIRVTNASGTELAREAVSVDTGASTGELHFKADSISSSSDTDFYIYYGNSSASDYVANDTYGRNAVWSDYEAVWHIGGGTDSTGNGNDLSSTGNVSFGDSSGVVGSATNFSGADGDEATTSDDSTLDVSGTFSFSAWANTDVLDSNFHTIAIKDSNYLLQIDGEDDLAFGHHSGSWNLLDASGFTVSTNTWYHVSGTFNDSTDARNLYIDGNNEASDTETSSPSPTSGDFIVGSSQGFEEWDGLIDEIRLRKEELSADWVSAEYTNQNSPTTFYTVSSSQTDNTVFGDDPSGDFADTDWDYREKITIQASEVDSTLTDFPVYVDLSDLSSQFFNNVNSDGGDIRVTTGDGTTEIAREVVSVDTGSNTGEMHFKADSISSSSDTDFYIYYGNSSASDYAPTETHGRNNVWANGYAGVWHLQENPADGSGAIIDSTGNANNGTATGTMTTSDSVAGQLSGNGIDFDGTDDYLNHGNDSSLDLTNDLTISVWINADTWDNVVHPGILSKRDSFSSMDWQFFNYNGTRIRFWYGSSGADQLFGGADLVPQTGVWNQLSITRDGNNWTLYSNGSSVISETNSASIPTGDSFRIGILGDGTGNNFDGSIDEVRLATAARSTDWVSAEYTNQNSPNTFYTVGTSQTEDESAAEPNSATEIRSGEFRGGIEFR